MSLGPLGANLRMQRFPERHARKIFQLGQLDSMESKVLESPSPVLDEFGVFIFVVRVGCDNDEDSLTLQYFIGSFATLYSKF